MRITIELEEFEIGYLQGWMWAGGFSSMDAAAGDYIREKVKEDCGEAYADLR